MTEGREKGGGRHAQQKPLRGAQAEVETGWLSGHRFSFGFPAPALHQPHHTSDGMLGEGLDVDEVVVGTVFLEPLADVLLAPQDYWPCQPAQRGACVVQAIVVRVQPTLQGKDGN